MTFPHFQLQQNNFSKAIRIKLFLEKQLLICDKHAVENKVVIIINNYITF